MFSSLVCQAQFQYTGCVKDLNSKTPLAFATLLTNTGNTTLSDIDGKFTVISYIKLTSIKVSYIGYTSIEIVLENDTKFNSIFLIPKNNQLREIVISSDTQGLAIIQKVIRNKAQNDPQKNFEVSSLKPTTNYSLLRIRILLKVRLIVFLLINLSKGKISK